MSIKRSIWRQKNEKNEDKFLRKNNFYSKTFSIVFNRKWINLKKFE